MILLLDNYDSFTYNLKQYIEELGYRCEVIRNDKITLDQIEDLKPSAIVISPGPGTPDSAGITLEMIRRFSGRVSILGVCLGHQAIGQAFGGKVIRARRPKHGKISRIKHRGVGVFSGIAETFRVARYHSLIVERGSLPDCLEVSAETEDGLIMGIRHRSMPDGKAVEGLQFHPESVASEYGREILLNFLKAAG